MNPYRNMDLPPFQSAPFVYPSLGRSILDSSLTVGRTVLITAVGLGLLIGAAMLIAFVVATGAGALGLQAG